MAFDPGVRRIGVAVSDELGLIASPVTTIVRSGWANDLLCLKDLIDEYHPQELLVGLPLLPSGGTGEQARYSQRFADTLGRELGLPVRLWNESYSSVEAASRRKATRRGRRQSQAIDAEAAAVFLQDYLDTRR